MGKIKDIIESSEYKKIAKDVSVFVKNRLEGYSGKNIESKVIHDSVWGSIKYTKWEMQIIDSPLFQRLRDINQVGLAMLTYPSARHSRFEHSLGVNAAVKKMCEKIESNCDFRIRENDFDNITFAALLHDIGHCFYSHLSERIYGHLSDFYELRNRFHKDLGLKPKPHEILSFIIINSVPFKKFSKEILFPDQKEDNVDKLLLRAGQMIIGHSIEDDKDIWSYMTSLINGPIDADKLDYIKRDCTTTGLALDYDIERLFTKIAVYEHTSNSTVDNNNKIEHRLVLNFNGVSALEGLTFCKIMLYSYIYYHQKVLITEEMIEDYIQGLVDIEKIKTIADFLKYTDSDILSLAKDHIKSKPFSQYDTSFNLVELSYKIKNRCLPKRCFEVSHSNIELVNKPIMDEEENDFFKKIFKGIKNGRYSLKKFEMEMQEKVRSTIYSLQAGGVPKLDKFLRKKKLDNLSYYELLIKRKELFELISKKYNKAKKEVTFGLFDVYIVFPPKVQYNNSSSVIPFVLGKSKKELMTVNDFIKLDDWAASFNSNKWRGYIFVSDKIDTKIAFEASQEYIFGKGAKIKNPGDYLKGIG